MISWPVLENRPFHPAASIRHKVSTLPLWLSQGKLVFLLDIRDLLHISSLPHDLAVPVHHTSRTFLSFCVRQTQTVCDRLVQRIKDRT